MELAWVYLRCSVQMQETLGSLACSKDKSIETDFGDYELIVFFQACQWHLLSTLLSVLFCCFVLFVIDSFPCSPGCLELTVLLLSSQDYRYYHILLLFCILYFLSLTRDLEWCILDIPHSFLQPTVEDQKFKWYPYRHNN